MPGSPMLRAGLCYAEEWNTMSPLDLPEPISCIGAGTAASDKFHVP